MPRKASTSPSGDTASTTRPASTASGRQFSFPWVVAPAKPTAKMAVLASNLTWNAYNSFGGRSNYIHADGLPPTPTVNSRAELKRYSDAGFFTWGAEGYPPLSLERVGPSSASFAIYRLTSPSAIPRDPSRQSGE